MGSYSGGSPKLLKKLEGKIENKMNERMGPVAKQLDKVLAEEKKQTKILGEILNAIKK